MRLTPLTLRSVAPDSSDTLIRRRGASPTSISTS